LLLNFGCSKTIRAKSQNLEVKPKESKFEKEVGSLNAFSENNNVILTWEINDDTDIAEIMILKKLLNSSNPDSVYKLEKRVEANTKRIEFKDFNKENREGI
jgi:hypothetical protein